MKLLDFVLLLLLFALLFIGVYILWLNLPTETVEFTQSQQNRTEQVFDLPTQSSQFYSNMRFPEKRIAYKVSASCSTERAADFKEAVKILEEKTLLSFYDFEDAELIVACSELAPEPEQEKYFVAGEGGPTEIINGTRFSVILSGKISLYREETCQTPQIAVHEILHALGFDHNGNRQSIMYPVTNCDQKLDSYIIDEINRLYAVPSNGDLTIEKIAANKSGRYLNFDVTVVNQGLKNIESSTLEIFENGEFVKSFDLGKIELGAKKKLAVTNLRVGRDVEKIVIRAQTSEEEISKTNNEIELVPAVNGEE